MESLGTTCVTIKSLLKPIEDQTGTIEDVLDCSYGNRIGQLRFSLGIFVFYFCPVGGSIVP